MSDYNNYEDDNTECDCPTCSLVDEFKALIKDNVDWESALRHIIYTATNQDDEIVSEIIEEIYSEAFEDGMLFSLEQTQKSLNKFVEDTSDEIYEVRDRRENPDDYDEPTVEIEKVEDLTDEQFESIQDILRKKM